MLHRSPWWNGRERGGLARVHTYREATHRVAPTLPAGPGPGALSARFGAV